jgi:hypothetical protein
MVALATTTPKFSPSTFFVDPGGIKNKNKRFKNQKYLSFSKTKTNGTASEIAAYKFPTNKTFFPKNGRGTGLTTRNYRQLIGLTALWLP